MIGLVELSRALGADLVWPGDPSRQDPSPPGSIAVDDVEHDSRRVGPGSLFACVPGEAHDGHRFAGDAVDAGAVGLLAERPMPAAVPCLVVESVRAALGPAAAAVHGHPSRRIDVAGVTGTNGKTTTVRLLAGLLRATGAGTAEIGTLTGRLTTPEATDLQRLLASALRRGESAAAVEVSSHGLVQHRVDGCRFRVAAFTNLGHDHLDYHGSMEDYFAAKARLFTSELADRAVVDTTTGWGKRLAERAASEIPVTEVDQGQIEVIEADTRSSTFCWRGQTVTLRMAGAFNRANAVLAAEVATALGMEPAAAAAGLAAATPVPGRFESVQAGQDFAVIVDYAHSPDALAAALRAARSLTGGTLTVVFGAGGERDRGKRPEMGTTADRLADRVIVTSDNPRSEDPEQIISEIVGGMSRAPERCDPDRRLAIRHALSVAAAGDTVLVAGKGHETSQTIGGERLPFDDRAVVSEEIERLASRGRIGAER
ncbi:MAG: UDP-N-acetylmuramoyl-L-alanyl-D-glutamate--2,6-diaminopimelate ligase [Acidimicrobiaceae bacterium]|nr:UDP-N-acetylmuramoyl-L-alanyl-D-glutamate--2,6-diaminopimelate ligase [Acidimicrobiaceae bacterium]MYL03550.1 UDP-N-acetylmuramoyl-L-alanyl-D-glutamate--2,6-diaminopimelate ligase [Acidimicrobiaceae bacterium]